VTVPALVTVVETPEFISRTRKLLTNAEREELVVHLARNPSAGDVAPGTGGIRKLRWGTVGRGKRGSIRVISFFHSVEVPLFALTAFSKTERADLSQADRNAFRATTKRLVETYRHRRG
jgi:hypothetical protein